MRLSDRLGDPQPAQAAGEPLADKPVTHPVALRPTDPLARLKERTQDQLFELMGPVITERDLKDRGALREIEQLLDAAVASQEDLLSAEERAEVIDAVIENMLGLGPIQRFIDDPLVTEIMVNAPDAIYVERHGRLEETSATFYSDSHLRATIERIVAGVGRRIDESTPMVDARLEDGSRVNAVLPPLAMDSPTLTIRKFSTDPLGSAELINNGTFTANVATFLRTCVEARCNILVSGGTGTGKTTLLNALSAFVPASERMITIEDTAELQLQRRHVVRMEARPPNMDGHGQVDIKDLVRNALRMRPDRIVVGECRGAEALDMLQAMNTGHDGSLTTLHANSARDGLARLETMVLMAGIDLPHRAIREQVSAGLDLIIQVSRLSDGSRRVVEISEVTGMELDTIQLNPIFEFDYAAGRDATGRFAGELTPVGVRPSFSERIQDLGHVLDASLFTTS